MYPTLPCIREMSSSSAAGVVLPGVAPAQIQSHLRQKPASENTTRGAASAPHSHALNAKFLHSNEEASSGGLFARSVCSLIRGSPGNNSRSGAINSSNTVEIRNAGILDGFAGPNVRCLRALSRDSGWLRGEAAPSCRDDGIRRAIRPLLMNLANPNIGSITDHTVAALSAGRDTVVWDRALTGFGVRVYPSGAKVYVVQTRGPDGSRRITVGRHGVIDAAEARRRAALIIARVRAGDDPAPKAHKTESVTVAALADRYLREHVAVRCKPTTAAQYRLAIERYIVPALGTLPVSSLGRAQVADLQHSLSDRPAMANLVIATLSRMIDQAMAWGVAGEMSNPCRSTQKYRTRRRERFLTDAEFRRLGQTLDELEATGRISPHAAAALRLLMLTGCRRNEILTLRWEEVQERPLKFPGALLSPMEYYSSMT